jgi:hypothetical protein
MRRRPGRWRLSSVLWMLLAFVGCAAAPSKHASLPDGKTPSAQTAPPSARPVELASAGQLPLGPVGLAELGIVLGATYDAALGRMFVIGNALDVETSPSEAQLGLALGRVAGQRMRPSISIDPPAGNLQGPLHDVTMTDDVLHTDFGWAMVEADRRLNIASDATTSQAMPWNSPLGALPTECRARARPTRDPRAFSGSGSRRARITSPMPDRTPCASNHQLKQLQSQGATYREPDAVGIEPALRPVGDANDVLLMVGHNDAAYDAWLGTSASNGHLENRLVYALTCDAPSNARRNSDAIAESGAIGIGTSLVKIDPTVLPVVLIEVGALLKEPPGQPLSSEALLRKAIERAIRHNSHDGELVKDLQGLLDHYLLQLSVVEPPEREGTQNG